MTSCRFGIVSFALSSSPCTYKGSARSVDLPAKCATRRSQLSMPVLVHSAAQHGLHASERSVYATRLATTRFCSARAPGPDDASGYRFVNPPQYCDQCGTALSPTSKPGRAEKRMQKRTASRPSPLRLLLQSEGTASCDWPLGSGPAALTSLRQPAWQVRSGPFQCGHVAEFQVAA